MKFVLNELKVSALLTLVLGLLLCGAYPAAVWAVGQALFPRQANGSLVVDKSGAIRGSTLLAQNFSAAGYFAPRASAAGTGYDATSSGGTNLGPTSLKLSESIEAALEAYRSANGLPAGAPVPADAVTASCSGLDPHISVENALDQAPRVARVRHLSLGEVKRLVAQCTEGRSLGVLGEPGVNVLRLNLALEAASHADPR